MTTILLALAAAALYGLSDFLGGVVSRRASVWAVAFVTQVTALVLIGAAAVLGGGTPTGAEWAWGVVAGIGVGMGTGFLYRGLSTGRMGVVAPLSAVGAALVPIAAGLATGERPDALTWGGIAVAFPAIWLVSTSTDPGDGRDGTMRGGSGATDGLLAGLGFGLQFTALGQVSEAAGLAPLAFGELVSVPTLIVLAILARGDWRPRERASLFGVVVGGLAAAGAILFLLATQSGLLAVASVLTSLYPAITVLLAATVLRERIGGWQGVGLVLAIVAVGLNAAG